jgi:hypothetical protein
MKRMSSGDGEERRRVKKVPRRPVGLRRAWENLQNLSSEVNRSLTLLSDRHFNLRPDVSDGHLRLPISPVAALTLLGSISPPSTGGDSGEGEVEQAFPGVTKNMTVIPTKVGIQNKAPA